MQQARGSPQIRRAYAFLRQMKTDGRPFTVEELSQESGWTITTTRANCSKKLRQFLTKVGGRFTCSGIARYDEGAFCRLCSQSFSHANDPEHPRLSREVEGLVIKAREAALAAVQCYNNPTARFRSENYIVLMIIAFTSLFHAVFERDAVEYVYRDSDGNVKRVADGEPMLWDILRCAKNYEQGRTTPMLKNLEFLVPLRNKIEHRPLPELDIAIYGHCQAMLLNFERVLVTEFSRYYALNTSLSMALQFSTERSKESVNAVRRVQAEEYSDIKAYINNFHALLANDIRNDQSFEFRVWLIPKIANRAKGSDLAIEFVPLDDATPEQLAELDRSIVAIKSEIRERVVDPSRECTLWEREVIATLHQKLGLKVPYGEHCRDLTGPMLRDVIKAHDIQSPSDMYFRQDKPGARPTYGSRLVEWICGEFARDPQFFYKSSQNARGRHGPSATARLLPTTTPTS